MLVEISDTIIEAIEKHDPNKRGVKYNTNIILWQWLIKNLPYDGHSELHDLDIEKDVN